MITRIGLVAGEIWNYLEDHERNVKFSSLTKALKNDNDIILMSLGWLAREGHVVLEGEGKDYVIRLVSR
ncbi:MAG: winged helix-turn-helix domain-containing protein [Candidatus Omnitrophica bacterium]|nr:winged helix-turn-helix domain-containing protein [Candidatus Omnitrophota bacterium]